MSPELVRGCEGTVSGMGEGDVRSPDAPGPGGASEAGESAETDSAKGRTRPVWLAALAALVTLLALYGAYSRQTSGVDGADSPEAPAALFQQSQAAGTSLTAVGRTTGLAESCTAWLVDANAAADADAYAVTSARCVGQADPTTVTASQDLEEASVDFNAFAPLTTAGEADLVRAPIEAIEWASVRGTDLAVLRLGTTYGELAGRGVRPIDPVAASEEGAEILIAGVPVEGIESNEQYLRGSRCQVGETSDVLEDGAARARRPGVGLRWDPRWVAGLAGVQSSRRGGGDGDDDDDRGDAGDRVRTRAAVPGRR